MERHLVKSNTDRMLTGVAGGLGEYLDIDSTLVRVGFVLLCIAGGSGLLIYIILAVIMPSVRQDEKGGIEEMSEEDVSEDVVPTTRKQRGRRERPRERAAIGIILMVIGGLILLANLDLLRWVDWGIVWAVGLIALGLVLIGGRWRRT